MDLDPNNPEKTMPDAKPTQAKAESGLMNLLCYLTNRDRRLLRAFYNEVDKRAQDNMIKTGKLEGSHYAAMKKLMDELGA